MRLLNWFVTMGAIAILVFVVMVMGVIPAVFVALVLCGWWSIGKEFFLGVAELFQSKPGTEPESGAPVPVMRWPFKIGAAFIGLCVVGSICAKLAGY